MFRAIRITFDRLPIRAKLIGFTLVVNTIVIAGLGWFFIQRESSQLYRASLVSANETVLVIGAAVTPALVFEDGQGVEDALRFLHANPRVKQAWVWDAEGTLIACYSRESHGEDSSPPKNDEEHDCDILEGICPHDAQRNGLLLAHDHLILKGQKVGTLTIAIDMSTVAEAAHRSMMMVIVVALLVLFASMGVLQALFSKVSHRIGQLAHGTRLLASGHFSSRLSPMGRDEIGQLAEDFNAMASSIEDAHEEISRASDQLRASRNQIENYAQGLEIMVTERTQELLSAKEAAEQASVAKSQFLANISHEIRTPLNGVIGLADMLATSDLGSDQGSWVDQITRCGETLLALINDVLDFSKIESGRLELDEAPFAPEVVVRGTVEMIRSKAEQKGLVLNVTAGGGTETLVSGDAMRLRQILLNPISNAVKFTERGRVTVEVQSAAGTNAGQHRLTFEVRDTGIGIPRNKLGAIFDDFVQADGSAERRFSGTGLGLAISKRLSRLMGGSLEVESTEGEGSTFRLTLDLPLATEAPRAEAA